MDWLVAQILHLAEMLRSGAITVEKFFEELRKLAKDYESN